jgi:hypothetical protein
MILGHGDPYLLYVLIILGHGDVFAVEKLMILGHGEVLETHLQSLHVL